MFKCEFCKYESNRKSNLIRHQNKKFNCNKKLEPIVSDPVETPVVVEPISYVVETPVVVEPMDEIIDSLIELHDIYHDRPELYDEPFLLSEFSNAMLFLENRFSIKKKSSKAYMLMTECRKRFCLNNHNKKRRHRMKSKKVKQNE